MVRLILVSMVSVFGNGNVESDTLLQSLKISKNDNSGGSGTDVGNNGGGHAVGHANDPPAEDGMLPAAKEAEDLAPLNSSSGIKKSTSQLQRDFDDITTSEEQDGNSAVGERTPTTTTTNEANENYSSYLQGSYNACPAGSRHIVTMATCVEAGKDLGLIYNTGHVDDQSMPSGCIASKTHRGEFMFNNVKSGATKDEVVFICGEKEITPCSAGLYEDVGEGHCVDSGNIRPTHAWGGAQLTAAQCRAKCTSISLCKGWDIHLLVNGRGSCNLSFLSVGCSVVSSLTKMRCGEGAATSIGKGSGHGHLDGNCMKKVQCTP